MGSGEWSSDKVRSVSDNLLRFVSAARAHRFDPRHERYSRLPEVRAQLDRLVLDNGYVFLLPFDQILETATYDFLEYPHSLHADFHLALSRATGLSGVVLHPGVAENYRYGDLARVPLIVKLNGATRIPSEHKDESAPFGEISDLVDLCVDLGAVAIGWTFFHGTPMHYENQRLMGNVILKAHGRGLPVIVWAYPRGQRVNERGGADALCNVADAVAHAVAAGADMVKVGYPEANTGEVRKKAMGSYRYVELDSEQGLRWVVNGPLAHLGVVVSGGPKITGKKFSLEEKTGAIVRAGADGLCYGRNIFQNRPREAVEVILAAMRVLDSHSRTGKTVADRVNVEEAVEFVSRHVLQP